MGLTELGEGKLGLFLCAMAGKVSYDRKPADWPLSGSVSRETDAADLPGMWLARWPTRASQDALAEESGFDVAAAAEEISRP